MGNHDTRHTGVQEKCEGTVLFFSSKGCQAHIWCVNSAMPLCVAFEDDFPGLWPKLVIGSVVSVVTVEESGITRVTEMALQVAKAQ
ncbi:MAG: hypothetical protein AAF686_03200 [Pseudomonadota bacterium]